MNASTKADALRARVAELEAEDANDQTHVSYYEWLGAVTALAKLEAEAEATKAAAPEMLEALQRAAPWLGKLIADGGHLHATLPNDALRTLDMVEAAIAKAEGSVPHRKVLTGLCTVCGHYGSDCTGEDGA